MVKAEHIDFAALIEYAAYLEKYKRYKARRRLRKPSLPPAGGATEAHLQTCSDCLEQLRSILQIRTLSEQDFGKLWDEVFPAWAGSLLPEDKVVAVSPKTEKEATPEALVPQKPLPPEKLLQWIVRAVENCHKSLVPSLSALETRLMKGLFKPESQLIPVTLVTMGEELVHGGTLRILWDVLEVIHISYDHPELKITIGGVGYRRALLLGEEHLYSGKIYPSGDKGGAPQTILLFILQDIREVLADKRSAGTLPPADLVLLADFLPE